MGIFVKGATVDNEGNFLFYFLSLYPTEAPNNFHIVYGANAMPIISLNAAEFYNILLILII